MGASIKKGIYQLVGLVSGPLIVEHSYTGPFTKNPQEIMGFCSQ